MVGLTGGIGSGKSTIARILHILGYPVYIADKEASRLINIHPGIRRDIIQNFGDAVYSQGWLDKTAMANIIFKDPQALATINSIVHPRVMEDFKQWSEKQKNTLIFFESAILFEAGLNSFFNQIICVTASPEIRLQRVVSRDHSSPEQVLERIRSQMDDTEKCKRSDCIIINDNEHMVLEQVLDILKKISI